MPKSENFKWEIEVYFVGVNIAKEAMKVHQLQRISYILQHCKHDKIAKRACKIETWDEFKRELKRQFYLEHVVYKARKKLK